MTFDHLWSMLYNHGATNTKRIECAELWERLTPTQQTQLVTTISTKIREDKFIHYDPLRAMQENIPKTRKLVMSADEYYRINGTQTNLNGWVRTFLPDQQKTIYIKTIN